MARLQKVAHVMRRFAPAKWGGTESVVFNLARESIRQGIESPVFCTSMFSTPGLDRLEEISVRRYRYVFPWFGLSAEAKDRLRLKGGSPLALGVFLGLLREKDLSLIHVHVQHRLGGMARTAAKLRGIPYVVSIHGGHFTLPPEQTEKMIDPFRGKPEWGKLFGWLFGARRVLDDADAIVCVGENEYAEVRQRYPFKKVFHLPNGVDVERFSSGSGVAFRSACGFRPEERIVLCVSRIDYQKNQLGLVRAFAAFAERHPAHRLVIIGPVTVEAYHTELLTEIDRLDIAGRVRVIPGFAPDDPLLPGAYHAAEMFVLPSHHEPFGIVILEAWAAGLPVVANRVGGIPGFATDRENILFADPASDADLAGRMAEMAENETLRRQLSVNARAEVSARYGWPAIARQMHGIYGQLVRQ